MKKLYFVMPVLLSLFMWSTATAQFSLRKNSTNVYAVDVLYTAPPAGQGVHYVQFFEFAVQIANPQGATLTATFTPGAPLASLPSISRSVGSEYGKRTFAFYSSAPPIISNTFNFPATEVILGRITFSPGPDAEQAIVSAIDYQDQSIYGGPGTGYAVWTMQVDVGIEVTNYTNLFYQSTASGPMPGSLAPTVVNEGSVSNQMLSLAATPLPLVMNEFDARKEKNRARLNWSTSMEKGTSYFVVERSADGKDFSTSVAHVAANGISSRHISYQAFDEAPIKGENYYRLMMVDADGSYTYSTTRKLVFEEHPASMVAVPNPCAQQTAIRITSEESETVAYTVTDAVGKLVRSGQWNILSGTTDHKLDLGNMPPGIYLINVHGKRVLGQLKLSLLGQ